MYRRIEARKEDFWTGDVRYSRPRIEVRMLVVRRTVFRCIFGMNLAEDI